MLSRAAAGVICLVEDDLPNSTLRSRVVPVIARNQMNVHVKDALPSCLTDIDANVISVRLKLVIDGIPLGHQERHAGVHLFCSKVEEVGTMP